jgi:hypothetical protein
LAPADPSIPTTMRFIPSSSHGQGGVPTHWRANSPRRVCPTSPVGSSPGQTDATDIEAKDCQGGPLCTVENANCTWVHERRTRRAARPPLVRHVRMSAMSGCLEVDHDHDDPSALTGLLQQSLRGWQVTDNGEIVQVNHQPHAHQRVRLARPGRTRVEELSGRTERWTASRTRWIVGSRRTRGPGCSRHSRHRSRRSRR